MDQQRSADISLAHLTEVLQKRTETQTKCTGKQSRQMPNLNITQLFIVILLVRLVLHFVAQAIILNGFASVSEHLQTQLEIYEFQS